MSEQELAEAFEAICPVERRHEALEFGPQGDMAAALRKLADLHGFAPVEVDLAFRFWLASKGHRGRHAPVLVTVGRPLVDSLRNDRRARAMRFLFEDGSELEAALSAPVLGLLARAAADVDAELPIVLGVYCGDVGFSLRRIGREARPALRDDDEEREEGVEG